MTANKETNLKSDPLNLNIWIIQCLIKKLTIQFTLTNQKCTYNANF